MELAESITLIRNVIAEIQDWLDLQKEATHPKYVVRLCQSLYIADKGGYPGGILDANIYVDQLEADSAAQRIMDFHSSVFPEPKAVPFKMALEQELAEFNEILVRLTKQA
jgi:hypothetical protein